MTVEVRGRPIFFPSLRALAMPALVLSMSLVRSCSATQPKMATRRGRTGLSVSSQGSRTDMTRTPSRSKLQDGLDGAHHGAMEPVEGPHGDGLDPAGSGVGE